MTYDLQDWISPHIPRSGDGTANPLVRHGPSARAPPTRLNPAQVTMVTQARFKRVTVARRAATIGCVGSPAPLSVINVAMVTVIRVTVSNSCNTASFS